MLTNTCLSTFHLLHNVCKLQVVLLWDCHWQLVLLLMHVGNNLNNGEINSKKYQLMLLVFVTILVGVDCDCADASDTCDCDFGNKKNVKT